jgi:uncharacterized protein YciI
LLPLHTQNLTQAFSSVKILSHMNFTSVFVLLSLLVTAGIQNHKSTFLVIYRPGPSWIEGKPVTQQVPKEHGKYMLQLYKDGLMKFAGPLTDDAGGAVVLEVADLSAANRVVADDPAVKAGIFVAEIHPWKMVPWETYLKKH